MPPLFNLYRKYPLETFMPLYRKVRITYEVEKLIILISSLIILVSKEYKATPYLHSRLSLVVVNKRRRFQVMGSSSSGRKKKRHQKEKSIYYVEKRAEHASVEDKKVVYEDGVER
ncbi:hypothetical protein MKX01_002376 [Papaver californicum]|nr:hypothetical protein MKX01_002376 [Papaver californicum]